MCVVTAVNQSKGAAMCEEDQHKLLSDKLDTVIVKQDETLKIMNGNGKIGMCAKVNILWTVSLFFVVSVAGLLLKVFILK